MRKFSESNNSFPTILEDSEFGLESAQDNDSASNAIYGSFPKTRLPKGSETFQQVLEEIQREREAKRTHSEKSPDEAGLPEKKTEEIIEDKGVGKLGKWKLAQLRVLGRSRSQRDSVSK